MLTAEQKASAKSLCQAGVKIQEITRKIFSDDSLDGRCREGKAIAAYLKSEGVEYTTTKFVMEKNVPKRLSEQDKQFIEDHWESMNAVQIAKTLFNDNDITGRHYGARNVKEYYDIVAKRSKKGRETALSAPPYEPMGTFDQACKAINRIGLTHLDPKKLSSLERECIKHLIKCMNTPRFLTMARRLLDLEQRELFESQFVAHIWDKPDLNSEDVAQYTDLCQDYVQQLITADQLSKMSKLFDLMDGDESDITSMTKNLKDKNDEYDKIAMRIQRLIDKLSGKRADRIKDKNNRNVNIVSLIEAFQDEEERKRMIMLADMQREAASDEADRLESLPEFQARVLGIKKYDTL